MANIPSTPKKVQTEEVQERSSTSESLLQKVGGSINWLIDNAQGLAIGSIDGTVLSEAQYQAINGAGFILADGRNIVGSTLSSITGATNAPDLRGRYLRMKSHGSGTNPDGDTAIGTVQAGAIASHTHSVTVTNPSSGSINRVAVFNPALVCDDGADQEGATGGLATVDFATFPNGTANGEATQVRVNWILRIN